VAEAVGGKAAAEAAALAAAKATEAAELPEAARPGLRGAPAGLARCPLAG
jgi:hypothetical protein